LSILSKVKFLWPIFFYQLNELSDRYHTHYRMVAIWFESRNSYR